LLHPVRWLDFIEKIKALKEKVPRLALCHLTWGVIPTPQTAARVSASSHVVALLL